MPAVIVAASTWNGAAFRYDSSFTDGSPWMKLVRAHPRNGSEICALLTVTC